MIPRPVTGAQPTSRIGTIPQMADSVWGPASAAAVPATTVRPRHSAVVRVTHWITTLSFLALLVSGVEILISHPRFYWGEAGNVLNSSVVQAADSGLQSDRAHRLRLRASRPERLEPLSSFPIRLGCCLDRLTLSVFRIVTGHFRRNLLPARADLSGAAALERNRRHLRFKPAQEDAWSYNVLQRLTYLFVIFVLFPLVIWTGLAMSPAIASAFPAAVTVLGGQQSARTLHFFVSVFLVLFLLVHVVMVGLSGFRNRMGAMITGRPATRIWRRT